MHSSPGIALTEYHRLSGLTSSSTCSHSSEGWKARVKVLLSEVVFGGLSSWHTGDCLNPVSHMAFLLCTHRERERELFHASPSSNKVNRPIWLRPHPYDLSSVQFSRSVMSDSLWPHGLQQARSPCPSPTPGVYSESCPLSQWCHPTISSSVIVLFSSCPQSLPASKSFPMSQLFVVRSFSFNISPSNEHQGLISFRMDWLDLLSVQGTLKSLLQHHSSKASILRHSAFFTV